MYRRYEAAISELEEISETAKNESARVGAVKARVEVIRTECDLLQDVGILPRNLGLLRNERDLRSIVAEIVMLFDKYSLPMKPTRSCSRRPASGASAWTEIQPPQAGRTG